MHLETSVTSVSIGTEPNCTSKNNRSVPRNRSSLVTEEPNPTDGSSAHASWLVLLSSVAGATRRFVDEVLSALRVGGSARPRVWELEEVTNAPPVLFCCFRHGLGLEIFFAEQSNACPPYVCTYMCMVCPWYDENMHRNTCRKYKCTITERVFSSMTKLWSISYQIFNYWLEVLNIYLIIKLIAHMETNLRNESIKSN
jgi:hypothetical protein